MFTKLGIVGMAGRGTLVVMMVLVPHGHDAVSRPALGGFYYSGPDQLQPVAGVVEIVVRHAGRNRRSPARLGILSAFALGRTASRKVDGISTEEFPNLSQESRLLRGLYCNSADPLFFAVLLPSARGAVFRLAFRRQHRGSNFFSLHPICGYHVALSFLWAYSGPGSLMKKVLGKRVYPRATLLVTLHDICTAATP